MVVFLNRFDHVPDGFKPFHEEKLKITFFIDFCRFFLENGQVCLIAGLKKTNSLSYAFNEPVLSRFYEKVIKIFIKINLSGPLKSLNISDSPTCPTKVNAEKEAQVHVL